MSIKSLFTLIDLKSGKKAGDKDIPSALAIAIGNFDGVHLGHKRLISAAVQMAEGFRSNGENVRSGVFCFSAPPADHLMSAPPRHICTLERKLEIAGELGARYALVGDFAALRNMNETEFIDFLKNECKCRAIVCGFNFKFGKGGKGNPETLKSNFGESALVIDAVTTENGVPISSSRIRELLINGDVEKANSLLGHAFSLDGEVLHGKELGRRLGMPTLNQNFSEKALIPKTGIYVSASIIDGKRHPAVTNIGTRPTVEQNGRINAETHLIDYEGELYGKKIRTELLHRLRDEKKFSSEEELRAAVALDVSSAKEYFKKKG